MLNVLSILCCAYMAQYTEQEICGRLSLIFGNLNTLLRYVDTVQHDIPMDNVDFVLEQLNAAKQVLDIMQTHFPQPVPDLEQLDSHLVTIIQHWDHARQLYFGNTQVLLSHEAPGRPKLHISQEQVSWCYYDFLASYCFSAVFSSVFFHAFL